jgi:hypothetical protein
MQTRPNDTFAGAPTEGRVKEPKGSKLDAKRRAEYKAELSRAKTWDTSGWPTWTITGRVLPERCGVWVAAQEANEVGPAGRIKLRVEVIQSHIAATCALEKGSPSVFEIADAVRTALAFPVDYIAFQHRAGYEIVLDLCINNQTGEAQAIPVYEPILEGKGADFSFDPRVDKSHLTIPFAAGGVAEFSTALHDLTSAVRYPFRTFEYCPYGGRSSTSTLRPPDHKGS